MFVMADNFVFQNPAHRKSANRYEQAPIQIQKPLSLDNYVKCFYASHRTIILTAVTISRGQFRSLPTADKFKKIFYRLTISHFARQPAP